MPARTTTATAARKIASVLSADGHEVNAVPGAPADLVTRTPSGRVRRLRVRAARYDHGCVQFNTRCTSRQQDPVDAWAAWCDQLEQGYVIDVDEVPSTMARLRVDPPANGQISGIVYAADHRIGQTDDGGYQLPAADQLEPVLQLAQAYLDHTADREQTSALQRHVARLAESYNVPTAADLTGLSVEQARGLIANDRAGRVAGHDSARGRRARTDLDEIADRVASHPAAAELHHLRADPSTFLFTVAVAATDGSAPAVGRFLTGMGWQRLAKSTVYARLRRLDDDRAAIERPAAVLG